MPCEKRLAALLVLGMWQSSHLTPGMTWVGVGYVDHHAAAVVHLTLRMADQVRRDGRPSACRSVWCPGPPSASCGSPRRCSALSTVRPAALRVASLVGLAYDVGRVGARGVRGVAGDALLAHLAGVGGVECHVRGEGVALAVEVPLTRVALQAAGCRRGQGEVGRGIGPGLVGEGVGIGLGQSLTPRVRRGRPLVVVVVAALGVAPVGEHEVRRRVREELGLRWDVGVRLTDPDTPLMSTKLRIGWLVV